VRPTASATASTSYVRRERRAFLLPGVRRSVSANYRWARADVCAKLASAWWRQCPHHAAIDRNDAVRRRSPPVRRHCLLLGSVTDVLCAIMMLDDGASYEFAGYSRRPSAIRLEPLRPSKCVCGDRQGSAAHLFDYGSNWTIAEGQRPPSMMLTRAPAYFRLHRSSTPDALALNSRAVDFIRRSGPDRRSSVSE
jgi:hypothetical protein